MVIKCVLDTRRPLASGEFPVKLRFYESKKTAYYTLNMCGNPETFDEDLGLFRTNDKKTKFDCMEYNKQINFLKARCEEIVWNYSMKSAHLSAIMLRDLISPETDTEGLIFEDGLAVDRKRLITIKDCFDAALETKSGKTHGAYRTTLKWITEFYGEIVYVKDLKADWLKDFEHKLSTTKNAVVRREGGENGLSINGIASHMKNLRAVFNHAIKAEIIPQDNYPFKFYTIKHQKTIKRAMPEDDLRRLFSYLPTTESEKLAIDICKMIFFSCGTSFKDLYHLTDFKDENMVYTRFKTNKLYNIYIHDELRVLFKEYEGEDGRLSFSQRSQNWVNRTVNNEIGYICDKLQIKRVTTYSMRHSWATYANKLNIPYDTIRLGLGHSAQGVTDVYIDYDMDIVKEANRKIIDFVLYNKTNKNK